MRLLVVEDDNTIRDFLTRALTEAGFRVDACAQGAEAERLAVEGVHDALVIDLTLPDMDGLNLIHRLRSQGVSAPVLILSARRSVDERVLGLESGGDDYLTKPFAVAEVLARLRALLRRSTPSQPEATRLRVADLELDLIRREAHRGGIELQLTQQEFALLEYLCRNAGRVVTRSMVLDHVWKMRFDTSVRSSALTPSPALPQALARATSAAGSLRPKSRTTKSPASHEHSTPCSTVSPLP